MRARARDPVEQVGPAVVAQPFEIGGGYVRLRHARIDLAFIGQNQLLLPAGQLGLHGEAELLQPLYIGRAQGRDFGRAQGERFVPHVQLVVGEAVPLLEQGVFALEQLVVFLERNQVPLALLAERNIQKPAPLAGAAAYKPQVVGHEQYGAQPAEQVGVLLQLFAADKQLLAPFAVEHGLKAHVPHRVARPHFQPGRVAAEADHLPVGRGAEALSAGEQPDCLYYIRFSLPVIAKNQGGAPAGREQLIFQVPKLVELDL